MSFVSALAGLTRAVARDYKELSSRVTRMEAPAETLVASEQLTAGDVVNIWSNTGAARVRRASAVFPGKEANGFVDADTAAGEAVVVRYVGSKSQEGAPLVPGATYFLSGTEPGGLALYPPTVSGHVVQVVGKASSHRTLVFNPGNSVVLA